MFLADPHVNMFLAVVTSLACLLVPSVSAQIKCGVPEVVANLKAQDITSTTIHLSWDPPASTECADHYKVTYCSYLYNEVRECAIKTAILPLNTTQYDLTELKPCRYNLVYVYTVAADGNETYEELFLYTGSGDPPKVEEVIVLYAGATNVTVGWNIPRGYSEQCYPGFKVCYSARGDSEETCSYTIDEQYSTLSVGILSPCTEYTFSVVTVDGNFAAESKTSARTYASVATAPQMPNITVKVHKDTAHVTWRAPNALSMTCAASYLVKRCQINRFNYSEDCETVWSETLPLNATEATVAGLGGCIENHIVVNLVGNNGHFSSGEAVVLDQDAEIPVPSDATVSDVTSSEMTLKYYKDNKDCVRALRACWLTEGEDENCWFDISVYSTTLMDLDLKPCSKYSVNFTALGFNGKFSENFTTSFLTGPRDVRHKVVELSPHSALLSWEPAPSTLQCGVDFNITWTRYGTSERLQSAVLPVNSTAYNVTGLSSCTEYVVSFATDGDNGTTSAETRSVFLTPLADVGPITNFDFLYIDDFVSLAISFPNNSLQCINTYVTCWHETGESLGQQDCEEGAISWASGVLKACVNYAFDVTATTNDNRTISGSTTFTPGPVKVANLTVNENAVERTVNLSWTNPPTNHLCVEYIQVTKTRVEDSKTEQERIANDTTSVLLRNLAPCTTYLFEVEPVLSGVDSGSNHLSRYTTSCSDATSLP